ncbi:MAG: hypothetical protein VX835_04160 [Pseudomonadota bacterium]|nr:hypothetical protein [Pseudomonadota bacterium]
MFRYIIFLVIVVSTSAWLWVNPGIVEIHVANLSVVMQLGTFIVLLIASLVLVKLVWQILKLPSWLRQKRTLRQDKKTNQLMKKLCIQMSQGQIIKVSQTKRTLENLPIHLLVLLAKVLNDQLTSKQISESILAHEDAEGLIRWIEGLGYLYHGEGVKAQEVLRIALSKYPKHSGIITVLAHSYFQDAQWALLYDLINQYKRYMPNDVIALYQDEVNYEYLLTLMNQPETFDQVWRKLPKEAKHSIHYMDLKIEHLLNQKSYKQAKTYIERCLDEHWYDDWVNQYMSIPDLDSKKCIKQLLFWFKKEPKNTILTNALAKAHMNANMLERAGTYFEATFSQSGDISDGLALLAFYQDNQPEKVAQLIPKISRLVD